MRSSSLASSHARSRTTLKPSRWTESGCCYVSGAGSPRCDRRRDPAVRVDDASDRTLPPAKREERIARHHLRENELAALFRETWATADEAAE